MTEIISTIVVALSALATAGATIVLVIITQRYVRLTNEILKATNKPEVILFLRYSRNSISFCVQNIGTGYASDVEFSGDLSFVSTRLGHKPVKLEELDLFKKGINYLGCGHKVDTVLCHTGDVRDLKKRSFKIIVSYKDSANKPFQQLFSFDIGNWKNTSQFISPHTDDVANAVEKVVQQLEQASRKQSSEHRQQWGSTRINQLLNIKDPQMVVLERIADALEKKSSDE